MSDHHSHNLVGASNKYINVINNKSFSCPCPCCDRVLKAEINK